MFSATQLALGLPEDLAPDTAAPLTNGHAGSAHDALTVSASPFSITGQAALDMTRRGFYVIPLCWPVGNQCGCPFHHTNEKEIGKAPLVAKGWQNLRMTESEVIEYWTKTPNANLGLLLEPSNLFCADCDSADADREATELQVPPGPRVTRGDHCHRYFKGVPGLAKSRLKWGRTGKIDLKGNGYMVGPGSLHRSGEVYKLDFPWDEVPLEDPPRWATDAVRASLNGVHQNGNSPATATVVGPFLIDPSATPPFDMFTALLDNSQHTREAWEHTRKIPDPSASGYDLALANDAALADWSDQDIVNLIIAHRRKWGEPLKAASYFTATVEKARDYALRRKLNVPTPDEAAQTTGDIHGRGAEIDFEKNLRDYLAASPQDRALIEVQGLFRTFGLSVATVRKVGRIGGLFELVLDDGRVIPLGDAEAVFSVKKSAAAIADSVQLNILLAPKMKEKWLPITQRIFTAAAEGVDIGSDKATEMLAWLYAFTGGRSERGLKRTATDSTGPSMAVQLTQVVNTQSSASFYTGEAHGGWFWTMAAELVIHVPSLVRFVTSGAYGQRVGHGDARARLYALGFHREHLQARTEEGKQVQARVFVSPKGFVPEE